MKRARPTECRQSPDLGDFLPFSRSDFLTCPLRFRWRRLRATVSANPETSDKTTSDKLNLFPAAAAGRFSDLNMEGPMQSS